MVVLCPQCKRALQAKSPYQNNQGKHDIFVECPKPRGCGKLVHCKTDGGRIESTYEIKKYPRMATLNGFSVDGPLAWKKEVGDLVEEARQSNYLLQHRGAAICLRIALEKVVNIHILLKTEPPRRWGGLERNIENASAAGRLQGTALDFANKIKSLGDNAAHPWTSSGPLLPTPGRVEQALGWMQEFLVQVGVV
jgi:hypothetical protein